MSILPLTLEDVSLKAGSASLLDGISLRIEAGPRTVILGPNGAGKSVLLRVCHGLLSPSRGQVRWHQKASNRQAMVFQKPVMLRRSVRANVGYGLKMHKVPKAEHASRIDEALRLTGLADKARRQAATLSIGEQQRLAIARAHVLRPEILFMDEPTASLDPGATGQIERLVIDIDAAGTKIVMTTHDLGQARRLADQVIFLHGGRVFEAADATTFFDTPRTPEAAAFLEGRLLW